tara:strand:- start:1664 stop:1984 length:321 start_codon:yes stop_codon:yes gene_type:complete
MLILQQKNFWYGQEIIWNSYRNKNGLFMERPALLNWWTGSTIYWRSKPMTSFRVWRKPLIYYPKPYGARNRIHPLTEKEREHRVREIEKQGGWIEEEEEDGKQHQA